MEAIVLSTSASGLLSSEGGRDILERQILPRYVPECRWFGGKARAARRFQIRELFPISPMDEAARLACVKIEYADDSSETYLLPLRVAAAGEPVEEEARIARFSDGATLFDAIHDVAFREELLQLILTGRAVEVGGGTQVTGMRGGGAERIAAVPASRVLRVEQSNSSIIYGDHIFLKLFRKLQEGVSPDVEITQYLSERRKFPHIPPFAGAIELRRTEGEPQVLALALAMVPNEGDAWAFTLGEVARFYECVRIVGGPPRVPDGWDSLTSGPSSTAAAAPPFSQRVVQLGKRTGEMHVALATETEDPAFAPELFTADDQAAMSETLAASVDELIQALKSGAAKIEETDRASLQRLIAAAPELRERASALGRNPVAVTKIRTHGDYHLGQVLNTGRDFVIIDFEGEPLRPLAERRKKQSPLRDVAGMLRSLHYAAHSGLAKHSSADRDTLKPWGGAWVREGSALLLQAWLEAVGRGSFVPESRDDLGRLLDAFLLQKAVYEVFYELNNRPTWVWIPIDGILQILDAPAGARLGAR